MKYITEDLLLKKQQSQTRSDTAGADLIPTRCLSILNIHVVEDITAGSWVRAVCVPTSIGGMQTLFQLIASHKQFVAAGVKELNLYLT